VTADKCSDFNWSRVAIGTVQFGLRYGVANKSGMVSKETAKKILQEAFSYGVKTLDTAISYGISEKILGEIDIKPWQVISKLPRVPDTVEDIPGHILQKVEGSLTRLNIQYLDVLLMHDPSQLLENSGPIIYKTLCEMKRQGLVKNIGISIYDPQDLDLLIKGRDFNIIQGPLNIFDQRILTSKWLDELDKRNIAFHARSIFLQGLLLMKDRPPFFEKWSKLFESWSLWLSEEGLTPLEGALYLVIVNPAIKKIILGLDCLEQLKQIKLAIDKIEKLNLHPPQFNIQDPLLLNPGKWNLS
jgi:aryl-alcohol dehydrogenase-like predicted oxidoreductase